MGLQVYSNEGSDDCVMSSVPTYLLSPDTDGYLRTPLPLQICPTCWGGLILEEDALTSGQWAKWL